MIDSDNLNKDEVQVAKTSIGFFKNQNLPSQTTRNKPNQDLVEVDYQLLEEAGETIDEFE